MTDTFNDIAGLAYQAAMTAFTVGLYGGLDAPENLTAEHVEKAAKWVRDEVLPGIPDEMIGDFLTAFFAAYVLKGIVRGARDAQSIATAALSVLVGDGVDIKDLIG